MSKNRHQEETAHARALRACADTAEDARSKAAGEFDHNQFCAETLTIRDKAGKPVPFVQQPAQRGLTAIIEQQRKRRRPIRIVVLKGRQVMVSSGTAGQFWRNVAFTPGQKALVVAHEEEATKNIFGYYAQLQESYRAAPAYEPGRLLNAKCVTHPVESEHHGTLLEYAGGGYIRVATANNLKTGRSFSLRFLHLSEYAFWRDARTLMTGLLQAVPDDPDTIVIVESTANGVGGDFHRLWLEASDPTIESDWIPYFFAWFDHPEYELTVDDPRAFELSLSDEERELAQRYNLRLGQLLWRRWAIRNKCQGSEEIFKQEYPCNPEEAFLFSGRPRFSLQHLGRMPILKGAPCGELQEYYNGPKPVIAFLPKERGPLVLYKKPVEGHQYVIGIDVAEGIDASETLGDPDPDYSVACVLDRINGDQVAKLRGRMEPAPFAEYVNALARWYHWAFLVPEANGPGIALIEQLLRDNWPPALIYHRRPQPDETFADTDSVVLQRLGWKTSGVTRVQLLARHDQAIREMSLVIRDPHTLAEHQYFVYGENNKPQATKGMHDDEVFAAALAGIGLEAAPADRTLAGVAKPGPPRGVGSGTVTRYGKRRQTERGVLVRL